MASTYGPSCKERWRTASFPDQPSPVPILISYRLCTKLQYLLCCHVITTEESNWLKVMWLRYGYDRLHTTSHPITIAVVKYTSSSSWSSVNTHCTVHTVQSHTGLWWAKPMITSYKLLQACISALPVSYIFSAPLCYLHTKLKTCAVQLATNSIVSLLSSPPHQQEYVRFLPCYHPQKVP